MPDDKRDDDLLLGPFKEILDSLGGGAIPSSLMSTGLIGRMFEIHRALLQQTLGSGSQGDGATQHEREAVKALMNCSLEVMQSTRDYRERVINAQSAFLERYAKLIEEALEKPGGAQSSSGGSSGGSSVDATQEASGKDSSSPASDT